MRHLLESLSYRGHISPGQGACLECLGLLFSSGIKPKLTLPSPTSHSMIQILNYPVLVRTYLVFLLLSLSHQWFAYRLFPTQNDHRIIAQVILQLPLHIPMPLLYGLANVLPVASYLGVSTDYPIPVLQPCGTCYLCHSLEKQHLLSVLIFIFYHSASQYA